MIDNYTLNDEGELVVDDSASKSQTKWKKIAVISIILCIALILFIAIIILLFSKSDKDDDNEKNNDKKNNILGEIICTYDIDSISILTPIISNDYEDKNINCEIEIDNNKFPFTKDIKFNNTGYQKVKYILYGDINMKNMFKGLDSLLMVEMNTMHNTKINSIESAFENCINLYFFNMTGFDTSQIKSLYKLFYGTKITSLDGFNFLIQF